MKTPLLCLFLFVQVLCFSQITFEEITPPVDFNIEAIRKSPAGEYFLQAANDHNSIYTSMDGQDWTKASLPVTHTLDKIQFFGDGTPVLKTSRRDHLVRRNGIWSFMKIPGARDNIRASFIKGDSLFVFQDNIFAYSLDKGETFAEFFRYPAWLTSHSTDLWKFDQHFVLYHTAGASDSLSVFDLNGNRVIRERLNLGIATINYNDCGEVLFNDNNNYYLLKEQGLIFTQGNTSSIIPNFSFNTFLSSQGGNYYTRDDNFIYKTNGCDFSWTVFANNDLIQSKLRVWVSAEEDIYLYDRTSDFFIRRLNGTTVWEENYLNINNAYVLNINESNQGDQISLTSNAYFNKRVSDANWFELDSGGVELYKLQYSPDGNLYLNRPTGILYSEDNGISFSIIDYPLSQFPIDYYDLFVLDDDILFIMNHLFGESYYTLDNGENWIQTNIGLVIDPPKVKLVDNYIIIADLDLEHTVTRINISTNESISEDLGDFYSLNYFGSTILDDGTIYFQGQKLNGNDPEGLYRYRFGEDLEFIGQFQDLQFLVEITSSGNELYAFGANGYYRFDGGNFVGYSYVGLPINGNKAFLISENEYLYVIVNSHKIFRSTAPLTFPRFITGTIFNDLDLSCVEDISDPTLKYWKVKVESDDYLRIKNTDSEGRFNFSVPTGDYTLSSQVINSSWGLCESSFDIEVGNDDTLINQNFLAEALADCADLELDFSTPLLRRCFDNYYSVRVRNTGPQRSNGTTLTLELDPFFDFSSASIPYTQIEPHIIEFDLSMLEVSDQITFKIFFNLSCNADLGMEHCLSGVLSDDNLCQDSRSTYEECQINIGAFDPNDKRIFNEEGAEIEAIDKGEYIYYHIRFQNTGTDTAFNVRIVDPLSSTLDINSLKMLSASHPYEFTISDGPDLEVIFENILLPDSTTNEPASHGYFKFKIKPLPEFDYGTVIPNHAAIYFDFNDPIITNEAVLIIQQPVSIREPSSLLEFDIFPNPTNNVIYMVMPQKDFDRMDTYEIVNKLGQLVKAPQGLKENALEVDDLVPGIYSVILKEEGTIVGVKKFIKQ